MYFFLYFLFPSSSVFSIVFSSFSFSHTRTFTFYGMTYSTCNFSIAAHWLCRCSVSLHLFIKCCFGHSLFGRVQGAQVVTAGTSISLFFSLFSFLPSSFDPQTVSQWTAFSVRLILLCMLCLSWLLLTWQDEVGID